MIPGVAPGGGFSGSSSASSGVNSSGQVDNHSVINFGAPPEVQTVKTLSNTAVLVLLGLAVLVLANKK
ncbi:hypothetical protein [Kistimonas asteriae]|uniref:hypothetical protein n=1 Tax=Kistimonas asteriae TaxID=517724 RepID=UPI001BABF3EE|nr:hypothetical protein [Kistimonas asteriae]